MGENGMNRVLNGMDGVVKSEKAPGIILIVSAVLAIIWANTPWSETYFHLWEYDLSIELGEYAIKKSLHHWINDGLMAMFFFVIGLELKREIIGGELSDFRKSVLPLTAAIGGMLFPAVIFLLFNSAGPDRNGWGIPMATDIAFALGVISLLGNRVPFSVKVFLTALAIADDLGAVLVIAFFYSSDISTLSLGAGAVFLALLLAGNYLGVRSTYFYGIIGIGGLWLAFLMSGVHATIAGVLAAIAIPARTKIDEIKFVARMENEIQTFHKIPPNDVTLLEPEQYKVIAKIIHLADQAATPLQNLEHKLQPWVTFLIMPLFAFANAGMTFRSGVFDAAFFQGVSMGVLTGLVIGKFAGIVSVCWIMIKLKLASLPGGWQWGHVFGIALLAGIGFTMSLFISLLAFTDVNLIAEAKAGIFIASVISGTAGYIVLKRASTPAPLVP